MYLFSTIINLEQSSKNPEKFNTCSAHSRFLVVIYVLFRNTQSDLRVRVSLPE